MIERSKEWWLRKAQSEGDAPVGAGYTPSPAREPEGEEKLIEEALRDLSCEAHICDQFCGTPRRRADRRGILSRLLRQAKVEAHEEAAKAGCQFCRNPTAIYHDTPVGDDEGWVHLKRSDLQPWESCERPEIWDAITKLRESGEGKP